MSLPIEVEGEAIACIEHLMGPMCLVYYPYRQEPDLYSWFKGETLHCFRCGADIAMVKRWRKEDWLAFKRHIVGHHRRRRTLLKLMAEVSS